MFRRRITHAFFAKSLWPLLNMSVKLSDLARRRSFPCEACTREKEHDEGLFCGLFRSVRCTWYRARRMFRCTCYCPDDFNRKVFRDRSSRWLYRGQQGHKRRRRPAPRWHSVYNERRNDDTQHSFVVLRRWHKTVQRLQQERWLADQRY